MDPSKYFQDPYSVKMLLSRLVVMYILGIPLGLGLAELPIGTWKLNGLTIPCIWPVQFMPSMLLSISAVARKVKDCFIDSEDERYHTQLQGFAMLLQSRRQ